MKKKRKINIVWRKCQLSFVYRCHLVWCFVSNAVRFQILFEASVDVNKILTNHDLPLLLIENSHCTVATLVQYIRLNHRLPHRLRHKLLSLHSSIAICFPFHSLGLHGKRCHLTPMKRPFHHADLWCSCVEKTGESQACLVNVKGQHG